MYEYALFLKNSRKDYDRAEEFYKKAIDIDPNSASKLGNYAHHLIISKNDFISAKKCIDKAFALQPGDLRLLLELWFYRYAHYQKYYKQGERELEKLIKHGAKSTGWNLQAHIEIATKNKHPDIEKLKYFADKITNFTNTSLLTGLIWTIWHLPVIIFTGYGENIGVLGIITTTIGAIAACFIINWIRLKSGSVWTSVILHASHNKFIQNLFDPLTSETDNSNLIIGEFGVVFTIVLDIFGFIFWRYRNSIEYSPAHNSGNCYTTTLKE